ncbi:MAG: tRNA-uridine aminocarboxypropyltransferase [Deltaproteobacteria bacterium]|nr:tRNA-uridine aminocarboxypropyltransferase [Deltaproteobacteria bacterium]
MSTRSQPQRRCIECRMMKALCICALCPRIETRTHLLLVLHQLEEHKSSNTGQLAVRVLSNSTQITRGVDITPESALPVPEGYQPLLLFPDPDARPVSDFAATDVPVCLVIPDGTWGQASRTRRRLSALATLPAIALPAAEASEYRLRSSGKLERISTLEAIARALEILEGERGAAVRSGLESIQRIMVERTLHLRGKLPADQVAGGIPEGFKT